jgi:uncharacterized protein
MQSHEGAVAELVIYPIKGLGGISQTSVEVCSGALKHDRNWLLVDESGEPLSCKKNPRLNDLTLEFDGADNLRLIAPNSSTISVSSANIDEWLLEFLHVRCSLQKLEPLKGMEQEPVSLISDETLVTFNDTLSTPYKPSRFRANILVKRCSALAECRWQRVFLGQVGFISRGDCVRPHLAFNDLPWKRTLSEGQNAFRAKLSTPSGQIAFGKYLAPLNDGLLSVGDRVNVP